MPGDFLNLLKLNYMNSTIEIKDMGKGAMIIIKTAVNGLEYSIRVEDARNYIEVSVPGGEQGLLVEPQFSNVVNIKTKGCN